MTCQLLVKDENNVLYYVSLNQKAMISLLRASEIYTNVT